MGDLKLNGATSGTITVTPTAVAGTNTITLPASTGTVALTASPTFSGTVTATTVTSPASTALTIQSAGTTAMTVSTSQNVGIGTTTPARKLDIQQSGTSYQFRIGDAGGLNYYDIGRDTGNGLLTFYGSQAAASGYVFSTVNGERMRIDTSGRLLVNTTGSLYRSEEKFAVYGTATFKPDATNLPPISVLGDSTSGYLISFYPNSGTPNVGLIVTNGSTTSYNTSSDYRLKENVVPITTGLATINLLNPVAYDWINSKLRGEGFLAHELQAVIPHAVTGEKDAVDDDGSIKPQGVDYSKIVVHLVAAIKELSAKNDALEARLAALEAK